MANNGPGSNLILFHLGKFALLGSGVLILLVSFLILAFAVLGFLGVAADMSIDENHALAWDALKIGLPVCAVGACLSGLGLVLIYSRPFSAWLQRIWGSTEKNSPSPW